MIKVAFDVGLNLPAPQWSVGFLVDSILLAPALEELLFRKVWFRTTSQLFFAGSYTVPALLVTIGFVCLHPQADMISLTAVFAASMVYTLVYHKTGRIEFAILCHAFFNALGLWL